MEFYCTLQYLPSTQYLWYSSGLVKENTPNIELNVATADGKGHVLEAFPLCFSFTPWGSNLLLVYTLSRLLPCWLVLSNFGQYLGRRKGSRSKGLARSSLFPTHVLSSQTKFQLASPYSSAQFFNTSYNLTLLKSCSWALLLFSDPLFPGPKKAPGFTFIES